MNEIYKQIPTSVICLLEKAGFKYKVGQFYISFMKEGSTLVFTFYMDYIIVVKGLEILAQLAFNAMLYERIKDWIPDKFTFLEIV